MLTSAIIDCDPGCDDVLALLLALTAPKLDVVAYIPQFGNTDVDAAYRNILKLYGVMDAHLKACPEEIERFPAFKRHIQAKRKPLLVKGAAGPVSGAVHTAKYFHGADGLGNITTLYGDSIPLPTEESLSHLLSFDHSGRQGYKAILDILQDCPDGTVTYIALGPLTNLALALREDAALFKRKVGLVSIMGGALDVPGNTSPVAEFNVYADATAANEVFSHSSSLPIYLLPLDVTSTHLLPWSQYTSFVDPSFPSPAPASSLSPLTRFTSSFLRHTQEVMAQYGKSAMELHDPLAVYLAMHYTPSPSASGSTTSSAGPNLVQLTDEWHVEKREFVVEDTGKYTLGMCVVDRRRISTKNEKEKGRSRAEIQEELDRRENQKSEPFAQARVQVDEPQQAQSKQAKGVNVVVDTPGSDRLLKDMLRLIWGVSQ
ncbi:MAG: hypothetical protein CYPHOPRED_000385 [Cyphobasidiales sp. Tagirdzhanova-0007]|nr:MAG: hypothetical protein CYPHOPRED_000385 [Cyphobasidiales sp. Tagirdzhanova-0007]